MMKKTWLFIAGVAVISQQSGYADVYKWSDPNGRQHYSDHHSAGKILPVNAGVSYLVVKKVFDGDTLLLTNGQKIRLLGINTPEVAGPNKRAEAGGEEAKSWLKRRLENKKVRLEGDVETQDKYRRRLAYVFAEDKQFVNKELVRLGLATVNIYPPNLKYVGTLLEAQNAAEKGAAGIWGNTVYASQPFQSLSAENYHGWKRISGQIKSVKSTHKYSYLIFSESVSLRIENSSLTLFNGLKEYVGKTVEARGWVNKNRDRFILLIRHPGDLKLLG